MKKLLIVAALLSSLLLTSCSTQPTELLDFDKAASSIVYNFYSLETPADLAVALPDDAPKAIYLQYSEVNVSSVSIDPYVIYTKQDDSYYCRGFVCVNIDYTSGGYSGTIEHYPTVEFYTDANMTQITQVKMEDADDINLL